MFVSNYNRLACQFIETFNYQKAPAVTIIVGEEGLGKTTLLSHLLHKIKKDVKNPILIDAQKYASKYAFAAYSGELSSFRKFFRSSKLLLLDNINLFKGKTKTIEELFHTLDTVIAQGGKTVMTFRGDDLCLDFLGNRLASRLNSGLVIHLNQPTPQEIDSFIEYYLSLVDQSDRSELPLLSKERTMKQAIQLVDRLVKYSSLEKAASAELREGIIAENIKIVLPLVCEYYETEEKEVFGRSKRLKNVQARYMVYLLLHERFHYSYQEISLYFKKDLSGLRNRCGKMKESNSETFETLCQKLYNQTKIRMS